MFWLMLSSSSYYLPCTFSAEKIPLNIRDHSILVDAAFVLFTVYFSQPSFYLFYRSLLVFSQH